MENSEVNADYLLNLFNIPKPNSRTSVAPASPSPSPQSDNSVECNQNTSDTVLSAEEDSEQELTNLTWLTQLKNLAAWPNSVNPILDDDFNDKPKVTNVLKKDTATDRFNKFIEQVTACRDKYNLSKDQYQSNSEAKPSFNYAQIIAMSMQENGKMTLQQICAWIEKKFAYYRARKNWNNSIRHNLSLHFGFRKIDRSKYEKGKGGYWELGIDSSKCERKRIRNKKSSSSSNLSKEEKNNSVDINQVMNFNNNNNEQSDKTRNEYINDLFSSDELKDFDLDSNLEVNTVIEDAFNKIESDNIFSGEEIASKQHNMNAVVTSLSTENCINLHYDDEENFLQASEEGVSSTIEMLDEEIPNGAIVNPTTMELNSEEIFLANDVPQPSENVVISILNNHPCEGPNVIVEPIPYTMSFDDSYKTYFDGIDAEFQFLRNCENRNDIIDSLYDITASDF